jgi:hypothetical protein
VSKDTPLTKEERLDLFDRISEFMMTKSPEVSTLEMTGLFVHQVSAYIFQSKMKKRSANQLLSNLLSLVRKDILMGIRELEVKFPREGKGGK